ncbi:MAG: hypothetical protein ACO1OG_01900 [Devosia sp.]
MLRIVLLSAILVTGFAAPAFAERNGETSIPPNCTLNPWTKKLTCHIWSTCTMDPFTKKMNCPTPKAARPE